MKRKFSLLVTIVFCLLLVAGILSACNDPVEGLESVAGSYFMKDDSAGWWELGLDGQWLNSLGERGTYEFTPGEGDEVSGELAFYDATGAVVYTGNVQGAGLGIKGDTEVLWNLEKNPNTVNFQAVYAYAEDLGYTGSLEDLVKLFKGDSAYGLAKKYGYTGTEKDWLDSLRGEKGSDGKSAYELVVELGYKGTLSDWLSSLMGDKGDKGDKGDQGDSAYEIACGFGFIGTIQEWLNSLGGNGIEKIEKTSSEGNVDTYTIYYTKGGTTTFTVTNGKSAYELAVENGYQGTVEEWLASLVGETGANGEDGKSAYELAVENGYEGTLDDWLESLVGATGATGEAGAYGKSAYELAVENGFEGSLEEWLTSLVGSSGKDGTDGADGEDGAPGADGVGIDRIEKSGSDGNVDTYTIYFTNGETTTFTVTNAVNSVPVTVTFEARGGVIEGYDYLDLTFVGGEYDAYTATILSGNAIEVLPIPVRSGLQFCGWFTGTTINDGQWLNNNTVSVDFTLYARWTSHPFVHYERVEPDCTNDGNIEYWYCPDCDQYFSDPGCTIVIDEGDIILPAAGHMMTEQPYKAATCTEDGNVAYWYCNVCEKYFSDSEGANSIRENQIGILATGHSYTETVVDPTCINGGYTLHECSLCGDSYRDNEVPKLGHNFVDGVCTVCGEQFYSDGLEFTLSGDKSYYTVTDVGTATGDIVIPDTFNGLPVCKIGEYAFYNCTDITSVTIHDAVTSNIGDYAFYNCSGLESVTIGNSITSIGSYAFYDCSNLESVTIGNSVTNISDYTFQYCSNLKSITIGNSLTNTGRYAFQYCGLESVYYTGDIAGWCGISFSGYGPTPLESAHNLYIDGELVTEIVIPDTVTEIGHNQFAGWSGTSITIPDSVTSIDGDAYGGDAFYDCSSLESVYYTGDIAGWCGISFEGSYSSNPLYYAHDLYIGGELVTEIVIPNTTTDIGRYQFAGWCGRSITISESVTSIGWQAFQDCTNLESVHYNGDIAGWCGILFESSNSNPLCYAHDLYIGKELVTEIVIPDTVTEIGDHQFIGWSGTSITIPDSATSIENAAFSGCNNITSITIPDSVTSIGNSAFSGCTGLTSIMFPNSMASIGMNAFSGCSSLKSITLPNLVKSGASAFSNCINLTSIIIPDTTTSIWLGADSFNGCSSLESVYYSGDIAGWCGIAFGYSSSNPLGYAHDLYIGGELVTEIVIPDTFTEIGDHQFIGWSGTSITIPDTVTSIGQYAFQDCSSLETFYYTGDIADWCGISFDYGSNPLTYAHDPYIGGKLVTEIVIPDTVTEIGNYQFAGWSGTSITIPDSVTSIGDSAFSGCSSLTAITIPDSVTSIGGYAFRSCNSLTSVTIPDSVTSIGYYAFENCSSLTSITIPNSVTSMEHSVFDHCSSLTSVIIGNSITSIGNYTFRGCSSLTSVTIGKSVISIGSNAFQNCNRLTVIFNYSGLNITAGSTGNGGVAIYAKLVFDENTIVTNDEGYLLNDSGTDVILLAHTSTDNAVVIPENVTRIGRYAFYGNTDIVSVTLPAGLKSIGGNAFEGCYNLREVYNNSGLSISKGSDSNGYVAYYAAKVYTAPDAVSDIYNENGYAVVDGVLYGYSGTQTELILPAGITSIEDYAFRGNTNITSVIIPDTVISIGSSAFQNCSSLTSVTIGNSVTSIGSSAFSGCSSLTSITIPDSVESMGSSAFSICDSLESVYYTGEITGWCGISFGNSFDSTPLTYAHDLYFGGELVTEIIIPDTVTEIGDYQFNGWSGTSITIPDTVTSIGSYAFYGCNSLTAVYYNGDIAGWCGISFDYGSNPLTYAHDPYIGGKLVTEIVIPDTVTEIGNYQFAGWSGTSITIPDSVTSIGDSAFSGCSSLTAITIPDSVTSIGGYAFSGTTQNVYITDIVSWCNIEFGGAAANPLSNGGVLWLNGELVLDLNIPAEAGAVGAYAFYDAERIKNVVIEEGVTEIGNYAFYSMYRLESVTIPKSVTSIGNYAFASSNSPRGNLEYIYYGGTEKDWLSITKGTNWDQYAGDYILVFQPETEKFDVMGEIFESDATENFADNAIVAGAEVTLAGEAGTYTLTAADGAFGFEDVPEGEYTLTVSKEGYITVIKEVFVDSNMFYRIVIDLDAVNTLTGKVTVADDDNDFGNNEPLEGAAVTITRLSSTNAFAYTALTDADGEYSFQGLTIGRYMITVSKEGYRTVTQQFNVYMYQNNIRNIVLEAIPGTNITDGNAAGKIIDSVTGYGVGGLTLDIYKGVNITSGTIIATLTSGENGRYVTPDLEPGNYTIAIRDNRTLSDENLRYNDGSIVIKILSDKLIDNQNGYVTNNRQLDVESIRIVLTWGVYPRDLDSHLDIDLADGTHAHTYYSDKTYYRDGQLMADLDLDDTTSYGPETTTVYVMEEGVYTFYVHDYTNRTSSNSTSLANSGAKVEVYLGNSSVAAYVAYVPDDPGTLWTVFSYDSVTGMITPINDVTYHSSPSSIGQ